MIHNFLSPFYEMYTVLVYGHSQYTSLSLLACELVLCYMYLPNFYYNYVAECYYLIAGKFRG